MTYHIPTARCNICGEIMPRWHNCIMARESRALFEEARNTDDPDKRKDLSKRAYDLATKAAEPKRTTP